jgi:serine/threonine protein kinase
MSVPVDPPIPQGDPLLDLLEPGFLVGGGRYTLRRVIGTGEGSVVWLAFDDQLGEELALKFLSTPVIAGAGALVDLRREVQKSRKLSHPNIVRIHDFFHAPEQPAFIAMEFVEGQSAHALRLANADQVFAWDQLKPLVEHACAALEYAHGEGLIHRSIKPRNLLLAPRGRWKLSDFGLPLLPSIRHPEQAFRSGSLPYLSPQLLDGEEEGGVADDIYALGATLYELLGGRPPFWAGDLAHQIRNTQPAPLSEHLLDLGITNEIPPEVSALVMACLAKDPARRPANAAAVASWINEGASGVAPILAPNLEDEPMSLIPPVEPKAAPAVKGWEDDALESGDEHEAGESFLSRNIGKFMALAGAFLLLALGFFWGARQEAANPSPGIDVPAQARNTEPAGGPVIEAGRGPRFSYRYQPRHALALDTNAVNSGVAFMRESPANANCSFVYAGGETNNSIGTITYTIRAADGHVIQNLDLSQSAAIFTSGQIQGEHSVDGGQTFRLFFSTPAYAGERRGYYRTANLIALNAPTVIVRYTLNRHEGFDYDLQFLRDADDAPAALEMSGTVVPAAQTLNTGVAEFPVAAKIPEIASTPDRSEGLDAVLAGDGSFTIVEQGGRRCWLVPKQPDHHLYFGIDAATRSTFGTECKIELEYRNTGTGEIVLHYDSTDASLPLNGAYKEHPNIIRRMNTGQWLKATFPIRDARFSNSQNEGADFRFHNRGDALLIRGVRITSRQ